jgi:hypothetical protein
MSQFNVSASVQGQKKLSEDNNLPHFAPKSGVCWNCKKNIYEPDERGFGITTERASTELVTGCPHCFRTYCD